MVTPITDLPKSQVNPPIEEFNAVQGLVDALKRDGFVRLEKFFSSEVVEQAYQEIQALYNQDLRERDATGATKPHYSSSVGSSILTPPSHLLLDIFGKSPMFDQMFERFLTDPLSSGTLEALAGKNLKLRGFNIRRMTGNLDPAPFPDRKSSIPHEWHIDSPGEICISFLFNDVPGPNHASTALVPGSHKHPYSPRWNCLFSRNAYSGHPVFLTANIFNRMLEKHAFKEATGGYGKKGDAYIFINDTWHGRQANLFGHQAMISFIGLFSTNYPFPDTVPPPSAEVLEQLPPRFREVVSQSLSSNEDKPFYLNEMLKEREPLRLFSLYHLAQIERKIAEMISPPIILFESLINLVTQKSHRHYRNVLKKQLLKFFKDGKPIYVAPLTKHLQEAIR